MFLPGVASPGAVDGLPDGICSRRDLCRLGEPAAVGNMWGARCFQPIRVCGCWAAAEGGGVG